MAQRPVKKTEEHKYIELQKIMVSLLDLNVGDIVEILLDVKENENGSSAEETFNSGETATIDTIKENYIYLSDGYAYPVYALRKDSNSFKLNNDYTAEIEDNGSVTVGCTTIEFDLLEKIFNAAQKKYDEYSG